MSTLYEIDRAIMNCCNQETGEMIYQEALDALMMQRSCAFDLGSTLDATAQVAIVEKWSAAHPIKTRQSVFIEQYPDAVLDGVGVLRLCPAPISAAYRRCDGECKNPEKVCSDCRREFWMQEVE